jgi:amino acid adenylation domain-containing protein
MSAAALPHPPTLHAGFVASAARWPDRPALLLGPARWTYAELDTAARRLAAGLLTVSRAPKRVGILARRSWASYTGVLGALLAGAAFVPLNPTLPAARLRTIVEVAELDAIVCEGQYLPLLRALLEGRGAPLPVVLVDAARSAAAAMDRVQVLDQDGLRATGLLRTPVPVAPQDIAYVLFTSGSTGAPKGVPISHANAAAFLAVNLERYAPRPDDVLSQTFEQSFDLSVFDQFMAWSAGAALCGFTPAELLAPLRVIQSQGITIWFSVPSVVAMQLRLGLVTPGSLPTLRLSLFCGEPLVQEHAQAWQDAAFLSVLENLYGPTELTIACAAHRWDPGRSPALCRNGIVPIGRVYGTLTSRIVDEALRPVARGECGELCVTGAQMFGGYWRNAEADAAAFLDAADGDAPRTRFYRTGDLVRELDGGELVFVGRRDHQIKVGGHRIELGEIEAALRAQPGVVEAAAFAWPPGAIPPERIVAAVSGKAHDADALRGRLLELLPPYMVPSTILVIDAMPRTSSGKLDRRAVSEALAGAARPRAETVSAG